MRISRLLILCAVSLLWSTPAAAQWTVEWYAEQDNNDINVTTEFPYWVNQARCLCDEASGTDEEAYLWAKLGRSGATGSSQVYVYLGDDCTNDAVVISEQCWEVAVFDMSEFVSGTQWVALPANRIVNPMGLTCSEQEDGTTSLFIIEGDINNDYAEKKDIPFDTQPLSAPQNVTIEAGENRAKISWEEPSSSADEIEYYNVLCSIDGTPVPGLSATPDWLSTEELCGKSLTVGDATDVGLNEDCTSGFTAGDQPTRCFVCATMGSNGFEAEFTNLENGVTYSFAVVSVDKSGNVSPVSEVVEATPEVTTDFAEQYAGAGGKETGGFCFVATAVYGDYDHPDVKRLRRFRDHVLAHSPAGQAFIRWYYANGFSLALIKHLQPEFGLLATLGVDALGWLADQVTGAGRTRGSGSLPLGLLLLGLVGAVANRRRPDRRAASEEESR